MDNIVMTPLKYLNLSNHPQPPNFPVLTGVMSATTEEGGRWGAMYPSLFKLQGQSIIH